MFDFCVIFVKGVYVGVFEFNLWGILVVICLTQIILVQIYLFVRLGKHLCSVCATQKKRLGNCLTLSCRLRLPRIRGNLKFP